MNVYRGPVRSRKLAARIEWALLPYIGFHCDKESGTWRWWMRPAYWIWKLAGHLPGGGMFEPQPPIVCNCDYCLGLTDERTP